MVIPLMMLNGGIDGGSGYNGPEQDTSQLGLPKLPKGWHFEVTDTGGKLFPCAIWLYGPQEMSIYHQASSMWIPRSKRILRRKARKLIRRGKRRARTYGGQWNDFAPAKSQA